MTAPGRSAVPLVVLAGGAGLASSCAAVGTTLLVVHVAGAPGRVVVQSAVAGLVVCGLVALGAAVWSRRLARALRALRADAVRRLQDPGAPNLASPTDSMAVRSSLEMLELARTLDALFVRVRVADDVAEQHRRSAETASAGMSELLSGLVAAEESARGQLSAELHDTVAQSLMMARSILSGDPSAAESARAAELVQDAEEQVRAVMARARPPALRDGDLARAVATLRDDLMARYALEVEVDWPVEPHPLPLATAITVYRFFQEALLNVVKHADVDRARASLHVDANGVVATVADDGPGFDPAQVRPDRGRHVGLGLLRERARLAGGSVEVASWPAQGTTLRLRLPLADARTRWAPAPRLLAS